MACIDLYEPIDPDNYDVVEEMILSDQIAWGRLQMLFDDNPDFTNWYNLRAMERHGVGR